MFNLITESRKQGNRWNGGFGEPQGDKSNLNFQLIKWKINKIWTLQIISKYDLNTNYKPKKQLYGLQISDITSIGNPKPPYQRIDTTATDKL